MDMSKFNNDIANASEKDLDDGPRYPDGDYVMAVIDHEEKPKGERNINGEYPQNGLWVTFKICEGPYAGKDYKEYFCLAHPTAKKFVKQGFYHLQQLYKAINFMPVEFSGTYGKRFKGSIKSVRQDNEAYPWSSTIKAYAPAPEPQGVTMDDVYVIDDQVVGQVQPQVTSDKVNPQTPRQPQNMVTPQHNPQTGPTTWTNAQAGDIPF